MGEFGQTGDVHDAAVTEAVEMVDDRGHRARVVGPDVGYGVALGEGGARGADDHGGQPQFVEERGARVVVARVDDEQAVHPVLGPPAAVDLALGVDVLDDLEEQAEPAVREHFLDAGDELEEERLDAERTGGAREHQPDGGGALAGERPGGGAGLPAELFGDPADAVAGGLGDAGAVVEREGHGALGDARAARDVLHRRSSGRCSAHASPPAPPPAGAGPAGPFH